MLRRFVEAWFPSLVGIRFTHAWGGPLGFPRDWLPTFAYDRRTGIASARGYTGHGVATANLAGRVLADLITGARTELTELPLVDHRSPSLGARAAPLARGPLRPGVAPPARRAIGADGQAADRPEPRRAPRRPLDPVAARLRRSPSRRRSPG